ncbi:hypothetical protein GQ54DRAFT_297763 [Martensiomyces pterosporus]|nr:hypothetical protein GQ54DRAFT_297763 [Martensiomyces pterosporus]
MTGSSKPENSYILRYFKLQGLCETTRLLLTAAQVEWTEENPDWPQQKENQPYGHIPVLLRKSAQGEVDFVLSESQVIERYIARKYGLLPANLEQAARQEQVRDRFTEVWLCHLGYCRAIGPRKDVLAVKYETEARKLVEVHSKILKENGSNGHYFGNTTSYADLAAYAFFKFFKHEGPRALERQLNIFSPENAPEINTLVEAIEADPILEPYFAAEKETGVRELTLFK